MFGRIWIIEAIDAHREVSEEFRLVVEFIFDDLLAYHKPTMIRDLKDKPVLSSDGEGTLNTLGWVMWVTKILRLATGIYYYTGAWLHGRISYIKQIYLIWEMEQRLLQCLPLRAGFGCGATDSIFSREFKFINMEGGQLKKISVNTLTYM